MGQKIETPKYTDEFKEEVVRYGIRHPEESTRSIIEKFGISDASYYKWKKQYGSNEGQIVSRGSGNHSSDEAKELARLKKENRDLKDALEVLKKAIGIVGR
jgi:transposase